MSATSKVSFTVRRPTPLSRPSSSGPDSDGQFKVPALPRHLTGTRSTTGSPLAGSREGSDDDDEAGIVFSNGVDRKQGANEPGSSDGDDASIEEELVTEFDQFSVQRCVHSCPAPRSGEIELTEVCAYNPYIPPYLGWYSLSDKKRKAPEPALVIPSLPNPDWREAARRRRAGGGPPVTRSQPSFVPEAARATTGADGSVGGLGTRDTINSGPQLVGLQVNKRLKVPPNERIIESAETTTIIGRVDEEKMEVEETEDQRAIRALLAGEDDTFVDINAIPVPALTETDALRQDVEMLPDSATVEDYARVPVSAFGLAMLRGMGWAEGTVASKSEKGRKHGLVEPYLPQARPALLGIGAKEQEAMDDGSGKHKKRFKDKRYIPVVRNEGDESSGSRSGTVSRRASRSPSRRDRDYGRDQYDDGDRKDDRDRDYSGRRKDRDYEGRNRDRDRKGDYNDQQRERRRNDDDRDRDRRKERGEQDYESRRRREYREERSSDRDGRTRRRNRES
ncbi:hypothetical protein ID866_2336 [Astraeus odoratus]|nr:hypothetical protein ID866_2336 [Astraeus odoratus]